MKKYTVLYFLILLFLMTSCADEADSLSYGDGSNSVEISLTLDGFDETDMRSRAEDDEDNKCLSVVNGLHFNITLKGEKHIFFSLLPGDEDVKLSGEVPNNVTVDVVTVLLSGEGSGRKTYLHFEGLKSDDIEKVEVIGNYSGNENLATPDGWEEALTKPLKPSETISSDDSCPLYGFATVADRKGSVDGHSACDLYEVALKRPYAMIKVKVDCSDLDEGRSVIPEAVQIVNVPVNCTLAYDYAPQSLDGIESNGIAGVPFVDGNENGIYRMQVSRMYTFENMANKHAEACKDADHPAKNEWEKNPNTTGDAYTAFTDDSDPDNLGRYCSYLLVRGTYRYQGKEGKINYRLFLGENVSYGFDVKRNTIYDITLVLTGDGGLGEAGYIGGDIDKPSAEGYKWRVDVNFPSIFITPGMVDINSTTEIVDFVLTDVDGVITDNSDLKYYLALYDMTSEKRPNIQCYYFGGAETFKYPSRYNSNVHPMIWNGDKWIDFGSIFALDNSSQFQDGEDAEGHKRYRYKIIFPPFMRWDLYLNDVECPYREYRMVLCAMSNSQGLNSTYWGDYEDYRKEPDVEGAGNSYHIPLNQYLKMRSGYVVAYSTVRQWSPIWVYEEHKATYDKNSDNCAFLLDRVDRFANGVKFGMSGVAPGTVTVYDTDKNSKNGFNAVLGIMSGDYNKALAEVCSSTSQYYMDYYFKRDYDKIGAASYGFFTGELPFYTKIGSTERTLIRQILFPVGDATWGFSDSYPKAKISSYNLFCCWSLPSKVEWDLFKKGNYSRELNNITTTGNLLVSPCKFSYAEYWTANYEDNTTACSFDYREGTFNTNRDRESSKLGVRYRYNEDDVVMCSGSGVMTEPGNPYEPATPKDHSKTKPENVKLDFSPLKL